MNPLNPLNLKNNALFLSCWYERSRPVQLVCFGIVIVLIIFLMFMLNDPHHVNSEQIKPGEIWKILFYVLAGVQTLVLLVQGSMVAWHMASRERTGGTLDFHRNSPEPVRAKILGLLFGSCWFEWLVFLILFAAELPFSLLPDISIDDILLFNVSLIFSAILFHAVFALFSFLPSNKQARSPVIGIVLFVFLGLPFLTHYLPGVEEPSLLAHLTGITAAHYLLHSPETQFYVWFFNFHVPLIVMQITLQIPLFLLVISGLKRIFREPNSPAWSKPHMLYFCGFIFLAMTGFFYAKYAHFVELRFIKGYDRTFERLVRGEYHEYMTAYFIAGLLTAFCCVPKYFKRSKYIVLTRKGLLKNKSFFDDGASGWNAMMIYMLIGWFFSLFYLSKPEMSVSGGIFCFWFLMNYVLAFSGFLEFFRLSRYRTSRIFFMTVMLAWWVFVPWATILASGHRLFDFHLGALLSPIFGMGYCFNVISDQKAIDHLLWIPPVFMTVLMWLLAYREHLAVERQAVASLKGNGT